MAKKTLPQVPPTKKVKQQPLKPAPRAEDSEEANARALPIDRKNALFTLQRVLGGISGVAQVLDFTHMDMISDDNDYYLICTGPSLVLFSAKDRMEEALARLEKTE